MGRLFGTDGVRGVANQGLDCELAMAIGRAAAFVLAREGQKRLKILVGKDTRLSSDMLECALTAGLCAVGADVVLLGCLPTPGVAHAVRQYGADAGIMISASHNPMEFNGIKIFNAQGYKLADEIENEIEDRVLDKEKEVELKTGRDIGRVARCDAAVDDYIECVARWLDEKLDGLKVVFDCAHGSASVTAPKLFKELGAECYFTACDPDGVNINDGVGSTHLNHLREAVRQQGADMGIAFDGDADRCLAIDETGTEIDGDKIIAIFARYLKQREKLAKDTAVVTVMTNLGFMDFCARYGIKTVRTAVGDRYVLEEMQREGYNLGGEQSGHIILSDYSTTGDGQLTAALLLSILKQNGGTASDLVKEISRYPQVLVNIKATADDKLNYQNSAEIAAFIGQKQNELGDSGRVLVRVSGTEPLIRVMVEGRETAQIEKIARAIERKINEIL